MWIIIPPCNTTLQSGNREWSIMMRYAMRSQRFGFVVVMRPFDAASSDASRDEPIVPGTIGWSFFRLLIAIELDFDAIFEHEPAIFDQQQRAAIRLLWLVSLR